MSTKKQDAERAALLEAALPNIAFDGWTEKAFAEAADMLSKDRREVKRLFPSLPMDAILFHSRQADAQLEATLKNDYAMDEMKIRERIATAVMVRLRQHNEQREAIRRAMGVLMLPWNSAASLKSLYETVDVMWRCAGDTSTDYNFYTKRALLGKVYTSTLYVWLNDDSEDLAETEAFLHRRIENVMQINKLKAQMSKPLDAFTQFAEQFMPSRKA